MTKLYLFFLLLIPSLSFADSVLVKGRTDLVSCHQIEGKLTPISKPFDDGNIQGTLVGYTFYSAPIFFRLITHSDQISINSISAKPKLSTVEGGCFLTFVVDSPASYEFIEPSARQRASRRKNLIVAQAVRE